MSTPSPSEGPPPYPAAGHLLTPPLGLHWLYEVLRHLDEAALRILLKGVQSRLGTAHEMPADLHVAQAIAHRLNNLLTLRDLQP